MFKKLNIWTLLIIVIILAAFYFISEYSDHSERNFKSKIISIDTSIVTSFVINNPEGAVLTLNKEGNNWFASSENKKYSTDNKIVKNLLSQFSNITVERVAATKKKNWAKYEVEDSTGIKVTVFANDEILGDLLIGKFSYIPADEAQNPASDNRRQPRGTMISYVRLVNENEVYAVIGYLKMMFSTELKSLRNKHLINVNKEDILKVIFDYPDNKFTLSKNNNSWTINGAVVDSALSVKYISKLAKLNSSSFVESNENKTSYYSIQLEGNNFIPIQLFAYEADTANKFIITSSANNDSYFSGAKKDLFEKTFVQKSNFFK